MKSKIENLKSKITIVGAGPAGASLAIRLAQKGFRVTLIERERFPRPKLFGEFISPECLRHFRDLDVFDEMLAAGGERIHETVFYTPNGKSVGVPSKWFDKNEAGALSLSRAEMDFRLLEKAKSIGVEVLEDYSVVGLSNEKDEFRGLKLRVRDDRLKEVFADLIIDATGRTQVLSKIISRKFQNSQSEKIENTKSKTQNRLVGFKAHFKNASLAENACEIYFFQGGYGGLSRVENDSANFCFLIRADAVKKFNSDVEQILENVVFKNTRAKASLKDARIIDDWLAVSVDGFGRKNLNPARNVFAVGDAGAFIDPFTGSGMLMAFESAEILAAVIKENSTAETIDEKYKIEHARKFQRRLYVCSLMRRA
ncbi:MAG TPA: FAD-dependent oxidoreductase, partial [Pyrinomonadaceae bacterium]|nr:FAD-dependent oxidoreductase [Pyrinomonadaceae bacterium]